jgi:hypothetical protein
LGKGLGRGLMTAGRAVLPYALPAAAMIGTGAAVDYGLGKLGVGKDKEGNDLQIDKKQDDANWAKMSMGQKIQSGVGRGIEKVGSALFLDNMSREAQADRVKNETEYFKDKDFVDSSKAQDDANWNKMSFGNKVLSGINRGGEKLSLFDSTKTTAARIRKETEEFNKDTPGAVTKAALDPVPGAATKEALAAPAPTVKNDLESLQAQRDKLAKQGPATDSPQSAMAHKNVLSSLDKAIEEKKSKPREEHVTGGPGAKDPVTAGAAAPATVKEEEKVKFGRSKVLQEQVGGSTIAGYEKGYELSGLKEDVAAADLAWKKFGKAERDDDKAGMDAAASEFTQLANKIKSPEYRAKMKEISDKQNNKKEEKVTGGPDAKNPVAAAPEALSANQMLAQQNVARAKAKADIVAPTGNGSGSLQSGQLPVVEKKTISGLATGTIPEEKGILSKAADTAKSIGSSIAGFFGFGDKKKPADTAAPSKAIAVTPKETVDGKPAAVQLSGGDKFKDALSNAVGSAKQMVKNGEVDPKHLDEAVDQVMANVEGVSPQSANVIEKAVRAELQNGLGTATVSKPTLGSGTTGYLDEMKARGINPSDPDGSLKLGLRGPNNAGNMVAKTSTENVDMGREAGKGGANNTVVSNNVSSNNTTKIVPMKANPRSEYTGSPLDRYTNRITVY